MGRRISSKRLRRADARGNLYYVRLNTEYGKFYKIGFTTLESVHARMSYSGSTDWKYIDEVLMFIYLPDAFEVEQTLHSYLDEKRTFGKYSANSAFPLSKNGQSELYTEDVLGLDPEYTHLQKNETELLLRNKRLLLANKSPQQDALENTLVNILTKLILIIFFPIALALIVFFSILDREDTKKEVLSFIDRLTGGKKESANKAIQLENKLQPIINRLKLEIIKSKATNW